MREDNIYVIIGLSLGLGLLVGLQRQYARSGIAGIRTFPLITLTGTLCGLLAQEYDGWILAAGLLAVITLFIIGNIHRKDVKHDPDDQGGITTEIAMVLMYAIGAYLVYGNQAVAVVITGVTTVLLHFKEELHTKIKKIGEGDLKAIVQFILISMVILPVLPDQTYDRYESLNPRDVWWMVVLIVGISLFGYFIYKLIGEKAGTFLNGILGGLISSTATTFSYAKKGKTPSAAKVAAYVILIATAVSLIRILVEIKVVAPSSFNYLVYPLAAELGVFIVLVAIFAFWKGKEKAEQLEQKNPAELKGAIIFGLLYAAISFISAFAKDKLGTDSLYAVSVLSGLTDMDAITLSTAKMTEHKSIEPTLGWKLILVAALSNLAFKSVMVFVLGNKYLGKIVAVLFGIGIIAGIAILLMWPK